MVSYIKICKQCRGAGFLYDANPYADPLLNVAGGATAITEYGRRMPFAHWTPHAGDIVALEKECPSCAGMGDLTWVRGKSLTPLVSADSKGAK